MATPRFGHTATLLVDGTVLIAGGLSSPDTQVTTVDLAEIYDPVSGIFSAGSAMIQPRQSHTATMLDDGMVLLAGGDDGRDALESAELFDPASRVFDKLTAVMSAPRVGHTATKLMDSSGRVLIVGGSPAFDPTNGIFEGSLSSGELFDPRSDGFIPLSFQMNFARSGHAATLLNSGAVLITGGVDQQGLPQSSAEIFQNSQAPFVPAGAMNVARFFHASILLQDHTVLIAGGIGASGVLASAEVFDPVRKTFTLLSNLMNEPRQSPALTLLGSGQVLIAGGSADDSTEIYDLISRTFTLFTSSSSQRLSPTATLLGTGNILIAGGFQLLSTPTGFDVRADESASRTLRSGRLVHAHGLDGDAARLSHRHSDRLATSVGADCRRREPRAYRDHPGRCTDLFADRIAARNLQYAGLAECASVSQ